MKKPKPTNPPITPPNRSRPSRTWPESSTPAHHPATGHVLSEVEGNNPYVPKQPRQKPKTKKGKPTVTIAPDPHSTRDVFINRPR